MDYVQEVEKNLFIINVVNDIIRNTLTKKHRKRGRD